MHARRLKDRGLADLGDSSSRVHGIVQRWEVAEDQGISKQQRFERNRETWEEYKKFLLEMQKWLDSVPGIYFPKENELEEREEDFTIDQLYDLIKKHRVTFFKPI